MQNFIKDNGIKTIFFIDLSKMLFSLLYHDMTLIIDATTMVYHIWSL